MATAKFKIWRGDANEADFVDYETEVYLIGTPAIGNLDDDENLEIVFSGYSASNKLFVINHDGSNMDGFPIDLGEKVKTGVALADFNGNGRDDIVVGTFSENLYLFYDDGTIAPGFPYQVGHDIVAAPVILDLDGQKRIFFGCRAVSYTHLTLPTKA